MHRCLQLQQRSYNRHEHVRAHGDPEGAFQDILGGAEERFHPRMSFHSVEEQLYLPSHLVALTDREWVEIPMVDGERRVLADLGISEAYMAQGFRVGLLKIEDRRSNRMVADHPDAGIGLAPCQALEAHALFGTGYEGRASLMESCKVREFAVTAIDDIKGAVLGNELIEDVHIVECTIATMQESRDNRGQIDHSVERECRLGWMERCPLKQRQTQLYGGGLEFVDCIRRSNVEGIVRLEVACRHDEPLCKRGIDTRIARRIGRCSECCVQCASEVPIDGACRVERERMHRLRADSPEKSAAQRGGRTTAQDSGRSWPCVSLCNA